MINLSDLTQTELWFIKTVGSVKKARRCEHDFKKSYDDVISFELIELKEVKGEL